MAGSDSGRRLCLLFEAKNGRFAIEANSIVEVAHPDRDGSSIRGVLELLDLSSFWGAGPEARPGIGLVLDTSPTLSLRVRKIIEVADVAHDPVFGVPPSLGVLLGPAVRGSVLHGNRLYLELVPDALAHAASAGPVKSRAVHEMDQSSPERALIFESQGMLYGIPLPLVSQVVAANEAYCPLPGPMGAASGLFPHAKTVWAIYSAPALVGSTSRREEFFVLAELGGQSIGLWASRALGVQGNFAPTEIPGTFLSPALKAPVVFWDWERMFS